MEDLPEEFLEWFQLTEVTLIFCDLILRRAANEIVDQMRDFLIGEGQEC